MYKGAIVGCGAVACQAHVPVWRAAAAFHMVAAVDPIPAHRAQLQTLLPEIRCYERLENLLEHEEIDFLDVCTPPVLHEEGIIVTPHIAWATRAARSRLLDASVANIAAFLRGKPINVVN